MLGLFNSRRTAVSYLRVALVLLAAFVPLLGQAASILGGLTFLGLPAEMAVLDSLGFASSLEKSLHSYVYLNSVGGVAFGQIAVSGDRSKVVGLEYDKSAEDGRRLVVIVERQGRFRTNIYDWQLIPIARFAKNDQSACFTLFGQLRNAPNGAKPAAGEHFLGYHSAFQNTLLGWRLMQSDILIIRPDACGLPAQQDGSYILGAGEERWLVQGRPNVDAQRQAYRSVQDVVDRSPQKFTSYVICDYEQKVTYTANPKTKLVSLTGNPYWYCWRRKIDDSDALRALHDQANKQANYLLHEERRVDANGLGGKRAEDYWDKRFSEIYDQIMSANQIQPLPELSRNLSDAIAKERGINPAVYDSLTTTMRYSALFRAVRQTNPDRYAQFLARMEKLQKTPGVKKLQKTPSVMSVLTPSVMVDPKDLAKASVEPR